MSDPKDDGLRMPYPLAGKKKRKKTRRKKKRKGRKTRRK